MQLIRGPHSCRIPSSGVVATIGNFDGVHLGHQVLIKRVIAEAKARCLPSMVIVFEPQPEEFFRPTAAPFRLTSFKEKWRALKAFPIDWVCCLPFNHKLSQISAQSFVEDILLQSLQIKSVVVGADFRFGHQRVGDVSQLKHYAERHDVSVIVCSDQSLGLQKISSTLIRRSLMHNQLHEAAQALGRAYSIFGRVIYGQQRGRTFGFPTANVCVKRQILPTKGVFCVLIQRKCGRVYQGVANLGTQPTVAGQRFQLEVHLFDFSGTLYGEYLEVFLLHHLRPERRYENVQALLKQIQQDVASAKQQFSNILKSFPVRVTTYE